MPAPGVSPNPMDGFLSRRPSSKFPDNRIALSIVMISSAGAPLSRAPGAKNPSLCIHTVWCNLWYRVAGKKLICHRRKKSPRVLRSSVVCWLVVVYLSNTLVAVAPNDSGQSKSIFSRPMSAVDQMEEGRFFRSRHEYPKAFFLSFLLFPQSASTFVRINSPPNVDDAEEAASERGRANRQKGPERVDQRRGAQRGVEERRHPRRFAGLSADHRDPARIG